MHAHSFRHLHSFATTGGSQPKLDEEELRRRRADDAEKERLQLEKDAAEMEAERDRGRRRQLYEPNSAGQWVPRAATSLCWAYSQL
jgi:hypothetical protein